MLENDGCDGGWPLYAFKYVKTIGSLATNANYSYVAGASPAQRRLYIVAPFALFKSTNKRLAALAG